MISPSLISWSAIRQGEQATPRLLEEEHHVLAWAIGNRSLQRRGGKKAAEGGGGGNALVGWRCLRELTAKCVDGEWWIYARCLYY